MDNYIFDLPPTAILRGQIYDDPDYIYLSGDVCEIELPNGFVIDVGGREIAKDPFIITVYREYFGRVSTQLKARSLEELKAFLPIVIRNYSKNITELLHE